MLPCAGRNRAPRPSAGRRCHPSVSDRGGDPPVLSAAGVPDKDGKAAPEREVVPGLRQALRWICESYKYNAVARVLAQHTELQDIFHMHGDARMLRRHLRDRLPYLHALPGTPSKDALPAAQPGEKREPPAQPLGGCPI